MSRTFRTIALSFGTFALVALMPAHGHAADKDDKARFYDFSDQLIDGDIKKPTTLYMESRQRARLARPTRLPTGRSRWLCSPER